MNHRFVCEMFIHMIYVSAVCERGIMSLRLRNSHKETILETILHLCFNRIMRSMCIWPSSPAPLLCSEVRVVVMAYGHSTLGTPDLRSKQRQA